MYIEVSFDTIFNMDYEGAREGERKFKLRNLDKIQANSCDTIFNMDYGSRKSAMDKRVNQKN